MFFYYVKFLFCDKITENVVGTMKKIIVFGFLSIFLVCNFAIGDVDPQSGITAKSKKNQYYYIDESGYKDGVGFVCDAKHKGDIIVGKRYQAGIDRSIHASKCDANGEWTEDRSFKGIKCTCKDDYEEGMEPLTWEARCKPNAVIKNAAGEVVGCYAVDGTNDVCPWNESDVESCKLKKKIKEESDSGKRWCSVLCDKNTNSDNGQTYICKEDGRARKCVNGDWVDVTIKTCVYEKECSDYGDSYEKEIGGVTYCAKQSYYDANSEKEFIKYKWPNDDAKYAVQTIINIENKNICIKKGDLAKTKTENKPAQINKNCTGNTYWNETLKQCAPICTHLANGGTVDGIDPDQLEKRKFCCGFKTEDAIWEGELDAGNCKCVSKNSEVLQRCQQGQKTPQEPIVEEGDEEAVLQLEEEAVASDVVAEQEYKTDADAITDAFNEVVDKLKSECDAAGGKIVDGECKFE